jgi:hypothetical protein
MKRLNNKLNIYGLSAIMDMVMKNTNWESNPYLPYSNRRRYQLSFRGELLLRDYEVTAKKVKNKCLCCNKTVTIDT